MSVSNREQGVPQIVLRTEYTDIPPYKYPQLWGATGDGITDDTAAIQACIDSVSANGGGVIYFLAGTYKYTNLNVPSNITLKGSGYQVTILDCTSVTANGITLANGARFVNIEDMTLHSSGASTGWAISGTVGVIGEFKIDRYRITGFRNGIDIWQAINSKIGIGRMAGQGRTVVGGIGIRLGNSATEVSTTVSIGQAYLADYETNIDNVYCPGLRCIGTVLETSKTAFKTAQHSYLYGCHWEANDTYDIYANGDGVVVFGDYGLDMTKVFLDSTYAAKNSLFHRKTGSFGGKRFKFGDVGDFGGCLSGTLADGTGTSIRISVSNPIKTGSGDDVHWENLATGGRHYWWSATTRFMEFDGAIFNHNSSLNIGFNLANYIQIAGAAASAEPVIQALGTDADISITITPKGAGTVDIRSSLNVGFNLANYLQLSGSATGNALLISAEGSDTAININIATKGTAILSWNNTQLTRTAYTTAISAITVGASPFTYTNAGVTPVQVFITGGDVTEVAYSRDEATFFVIGVVTTQGAVTGQMVLLAPGDSVRVTYTAAPTMNLIPM